MSTLTADSDRRATLTPLRRSWAADKPLTLVGVAMVALLAATTIGLVTDPRVVTGAPAWLKPTKFAISIAVYSFTFLWLLTQISGHRRLVRLASWVTAIAFVVEMVLITGAAAAGTSSHFNISTPVHQAVWSTMGTAIVAAWLANLLVGFLLLRQRRPDRAFAWSLRLGVLISAVGMGVAFFMTSPTAQQLQAAQAGAGMPVVGAHSVGVADGGPGLPVLGWSTAGGDLRVAHFIGLHALQVLPLLGFVISRYGPAWLRPADRTALVVVAGLGYLATVGISTWQALRAQSVVNPDGLTLGTAGAVLAATIAATATIIVVARHATNGTPA